MRLIIPDEPEVTVRLRTLIGYDLGVLAVMVLGTRTSLYANASELMASGWGLLFRQVWTATCICLLVQQYDRWRMLDPANRTKTRNLAWLVLYATVILVFPFGWYGLGYVVVYHQIWIANPNDLPVGLALILLPFWCNIPFAVQSKDANPSS